MAADVYLQEAAGRVHDAIGALHADIQTIQTEAYRTEAHLHDEAAKAEREAAAVKVEMRLSQDGPHIAALEARIRQLEADAHDKNNEATRIGADAARNVSEKTNLLNGLENIARQLESSAASVRY